MIDNIKNFFMRHLQVSDQGAPTEHQLQLAAAALLLEVSRADFDIQQEELVEIGDALRNHFNFSRPETDELMTLAVEQNEQHISIHPFVQLINEHFSAQQKTRIIEDMWRVAYADRKLDKFEEYQIRKIADLLYVPHSEFIRTKLRVQQAFGIEA